MGPWDQPRVIDYEDGGILSAIESLPLTLAPGEPLYAEFHDGQVHDLLGGAACAFQDDLVEPLLGGLVNDEFLSGDGGWDPSGKAKAARRMPTRPIIMHAVAQPNNSSHCGTLLIFCYAFAVASAMQDRMQTAAAAYAPDGGTGSGGGIISGRTPHLLDWRAGRSCPSRCMGGTAGGMTGWSCLRWMGWRRTGC